MKYNTKHKCYYVDYRENNDFMNLEEMKSFTQDELNYLELKIYQDDFVQIFGLDQEDFKDEELNATVHEIYLKAKEHDKLRQCIEKISGSTLQEDLEVGLMILFSMDYLYVFHPCLCEFLETGAISSENLDKLIKAVFT